MGMIILIVIVVLIFIISNKINEKWYNELSENEKIRIRELDLRLSELNERVKKQMPKKYMLYRELNLLAKKLVPEEEIMYFTKANLHIYKKNTDTIVLGYIYITNKKVLLLSKKNAKTIPIEKISSIDTGKKIGNNWIKINDNNTTTEITRIPEHDMERVQQEINNGMEKHKNVSISITQTTEKDVADKIARLQVLYKEGVLTEYEFNTKKLELLDKIK